MKAAKKEGRRRQQHEWYAENKDWKVLRAGINRQKRRKNFAV